MCSLSNSRCDWLPAHGRAGPHVVTCPAPAGAGRSALFSTPRHACKPPARPFIPGTCLRSGTIHYRLPLQANNAGALSAGCAPLCAGGLDRGSQGPAGKKAKAVHPFREKWINAPAGEVTQPLSYFLATWVAAWEERACLRSTAPQPHKPCIGGECVCQLLTGCNNNCRHAFQCSPSEANKNKSYARVVMESHVDPETKQTIRYCRLLRRMRAEEATLMRRSLRVFSFCLVFVASSSRLELEYQSKNRNCIVKGRLQQHEGRCSGGADAAGRRQALLYDPHALARASLSP